MGDLTADRFAEFYEAVHAHPPHPWQLRLAKDVIGGKQWPSSINIPTGCGKTSCIDIAVYAMACNPESNPRRIVYAVNRRVVVDGAHERAKMIECRLECASGGILLDVRDRLCSISGGGDTPLKSVLLRGGTYIDKGWGANPAQPCVVSTTVDQAGSRLLFRGYGVGRLSRVVEAGLLGNDCLWILDETHVSQQFTKTLRCVEEYRNEPWAKKDLRRPWSVVEMTATPVGDGPSRPICSATSTPFVEMTATPVGDGPPGFELDGDDRGSDTLARVLGARKVCDLVKSKAKDSGDNDALAEDLVEEALQLHKKHSCREVAVVANRVATARLAYAKLQKKKLDAHLLIGRMRPWDRDVILSRLGRFRTASPRGSAPDDGEQGGGSRPQRPTFVVSTQCLEVGADLDFDGMVSEASSLDSLRQRFGRLNRSGRREPCRGAIVATAAVHKGKGDSDGDPIYGIAAVKTWAFLAGGGEDEIDLGIDAMSDLLKEVADGQSTLGEMSVAPPDGPKLLPSHVDMMCQTQHHSNAVPDVAPFLHGFERGMPTVSVVWRSGFRGDDPDDVRLDVYGDFFVVLDALPPRSAESMPVPLWSIRRYLEAGRVGPDTGSDAEWQRSNAYESVGDEAPDGRFPTAFIWRGKKDKYIIARDDQMERNLLGELRAHKRAIGFKIARVGDIRPHDVVILSASEGGWNDLGHVPDTAGNGAEGDDGYLAIDIAEKVAFASAGGIAEVGGDNGCIHDGEKRSGYQLQSRIAIRMADDGRYPLPMTDEARRFKSASDSGEPRSTRNEILNEARKKLPDLVQQLAKNANPGRDHDTDGDPDDLRDARREDACGGLDLDSIACSMKVMEGGGVLLKAWRKPGRDRSGTDRLLDVHMSNVADAAKRYAKSLGFGQDDGLADLLDTTARLHDAGKADQRFQRMLHRSTLPLPANEPLLAKDNGLPRTGHDYYPKGFRHELVSSRLAEGVDAPDRDLLLHLIESHHGYCRPSAPPVRDPDAGPVEYKFKGRMLRATPATGLEKVGSGASRRFWECTRRYGWWGLAWITALFLLADWEVSRRGSPR